MIPGNMEAYLRHHLPAAVVENRIVRVNGKCFLEFGYTDEQLLSRMGISCDKLGPRLVACMWDEAAALEIMTRAVIAAAPSWGILEVVTELEQNQISAMPVVEDGAVLGMVSSDLLAQRYLLRLLRSQTNRNLH